MQPSSDLARELSLGSLSLSRLQIHSENQI